MLAIRLSRTGKKNFSFFRVVVMDKQKSAKGRALEVVGSVNPHTKEINLKQERILYWIGVGAQPSDRVHNILVSKEIIKGVKRPRKIRKSKKSAEEIAAEEAPKQEINAGNEVTSNGVTEEKVEEPTEAKIEEKSEEVKEETKSEEKTEEKVEDKVEEEKKETAETETEKPKEEVTEQKEEEKTEEPKEEKAAKTTEKPKKEEKKEEDKTTEDK